MASSADSKELSPEERLLRLVGDVLGANGVAHALIGGAARNIYGEARVTFDLDFTVRGAPSALLSARDALLAAGLSLLAEQQSTPEYGPGLLRFRDTTTGIGLDLERATTEFEDILLDRAVQLDSSGGVPVATPEDLIILKLIAFRAKDQRDLTELVSRSDLNWDYVTGWAMRWQVQDRLAVSRRAAAGDEAELHP